VQRKSVHFIIFLIVFFFPGQIVHGESEIFFGGTAKLFTAVFTADDPSALSVPPHKAGDFSITRGELRLKLDGYASDNVSFKTQVYFISTADPTYESLAETESGKGFSSNMHDVDTYFKEANFKLMDFLAPGLDLTIGRQRVRWGTSDEYNVIDNLNPVDFANLFLFDPDYFVEHLPMDGCSAEYLFPFDFELKLTLGSMLEVADFKDVSKYSAWVITPEVEYKPFDGTSLRLGYAIINGASSSKFGAFSDSDICFLLLKTIF